MFKRVFCLIAGFSCGISVSAAQAQSIPNIELEGIAYEIGFEFGQVDLQPDSEFETLIRSQPWYTGSRFSADLAYSAVSQVYNCDGIDFLSQCATPFDAFGSTNNSGTWSPFFAIACCEPDDEVVLAQAFVGSIDSDPSLGKNLLLSGVNGSPVSPNDFREGFFAIATAVIPAKSVPEPLAFNILGLISAVGVGAALKKKPQ